jgi:hypothetical protein
MVAVKPEHTTALQKLTQEEVLQAVKALYDTIQEDLPEQVHKAMGKYLDTLVKSYEDRLRVLQKAFDLQIADLKTQIGKRRLEKSIVYDATGRPSMIVEEAKVK